jgi:hypothetical protein
VLHNQYVTYKNYEFIRIMYEFFFFFDMSTQMGEEGFELVTSTSWGVVPSRLNYQFETIMHERYIINMYRIIIMTINNTLTSKTSQPCSIKKELNLMIWVHLFSLLPLPLGPLSSFGPWFMYNLNLTIAQSQNTLGLCNSIGVM